MNNELLDFESDHDGTNDQTKPLNWADITALLNLSIRIIPKKHNINVADSNNFRGIARNSVFCKLFDNAVLEKFHAN